MSRLSHSQKYWLNFEGPNIKMRQSFLDCLKANPVSLLPLFRSAWNENLFCHIGTPNAKFGTLQLFTWDCPKLSHFFFWTYETTAWVVSKMSNLPKSGSDREASFWRLSKSSENPYNTPRQPLRERSAPPCTIRSAQVHGAATRYDHRQSEWYMPCTGGL